MDNNIFIPKKINIGFQKRTGTYTKKLAYVIYFDNKGVLRKETSWQSWRDTKIDNIIYDNTPVEGFVLNKKVGDYRSDWNHRQAYVRVYDPRDFEFEITIENLLYILENTSSIKGKGLEGEFVYGWGGKDLILIPITSPDYQDLIKFNEVVHSNKSIKSKDLKIGATYLTKQNEKWVYMGKYIDYSNSEKSCFWFYNGVDYRGKSNFSRITSLSNKIIDVVDENCVNNYAELFDNLECDSSYSPYDESKDEYVPYELNDFIDKLKNMNWCSTCYDSTHAIVEIKNATYKSPNFLIGKNVRKQDAWGYNSPYTEFEKQEYTADEVFNKIHPYYKKLYLKNNKYYGRD